MPRKCLQEFEKDLQGNDYLLHFPLLRFAKEYVKNLPEITENVARLSDVDLDEARKSYYPLDKSESDVQGLKKNGQLVRKHPSSSAKIAQAEIATRLGYLMRIQTKDKPLSWLDRGALAKKTKDLVATAIYDATGAVDQPSQEKMQTMQDLVKFTPLRKRHSLNRAIAGATKSQTT